MKYPEYCGTYYDKFKVTEIDQSVVSVRFFSDNHNDWIDAWAHAEIKEITLHVGDSFNPENDHDEEFDVYLLPEDALWETEDSSIHQVICSYFVFNKHIAEINKVLEDNFADNYL